MDTDFGVLRARADVQGMVDIFCALLVRLRDTHIEEEDVVLEGLKLILALTMVSAREQRKQAVQVHGFAELA